MKSFVYAAAAAALVMASTARAETSSWDVEFCPAEQVRTYPAEEARGVQSLLLQNFAVVNHGAAPLRIERVTITLLRDGQAIDSRVLAGPDLQRFADAGPKIQGSGMLDLAAFQFCGKDLIKPGVKLAGPSLGRDEALLVMQQAFVFSGKRDALRVSVDGELSGRQAETSATLPIKSGFAQTKFIFPLRGVWWAGNGPTFNTAHRWALPEEFAFDIVKLDAGGLTHHDDGSRFSDYYAYGADVLAAADGRVVAVGKDQQEIPSAMQQPGETQDAYYVRLRAEQGERLSKGVDGVAGNYVMIDHGNGEYSLYAHLKLGSVRVRGGDTVKAGQTIGQIGSSGNSSEPHLHFQVCDRPDPLMCAGIPVNFTNVLLPYADGPRAVQSGDIVVAK
jgi:murein DD-endopeptidase MepM/ murein hydrolase activator NlpD